MTIKDIKEKIARRKLAKITSAIERTPVFPNINTVKTIGVIWQPTQKEAFQYLKSYFNREQVIFRGFCVFEAITNPHQDANTLTVKDLDFWGLPKKDKVDEFINIRFEVLFNIAFEDNLVLDYITALSQARFKVGSTQIINNYFDLNINIGENQDAVYLAKQQIFYLAQLNKK
ncbi:MAG: hypothetical protein FD181_2848 [Prolixibacteraceae bacterium]|nr:MAG: hypothetical protein FD181_2848 [Prolixibacteraceae bacterium]